MSAAVTWFPQINTNAIITQLPYEVSQDFDTVAVDMESGMRWAFPRRSPALSGYVSGPLDRFGVSFSNITDDEVGQLTAFFDSVRGSWGAFRFLDPGGNLLQYSEDFSQSYWDKSIGPVTVGAAVVDPFGGSRALAMSAGAGDSMMRATVGPGDGQLLGFRLTASAWVQARDSGTSIFVGFQNANTATLVGSTWKLPYAQWVRVWDSETISWQDPTYAVLGGNGTWSGGRILYLFGFQVVPMKGAGEYAKTPGNYGYHPSCRLAIDSMDIKMLGPNENQVLLPVQEFAP